LKDQNPQVTKTFLTAINMTKDSDGSRLLFYHYLDGGTNKSYRYSEEEKEKLKTVSFPSLLPPTGKNYGSIIFIIRIKEMEFTQFHWQI